LVHSRAGAGGGRATVTDDTGSDAAIYGVHILSMQGTSFSNCRASVEADTKQSEIAWGFQPNGE